MRQGLLFALMVAGVCLLGPAAKSPGEKIFAQALASWEKRGSLEEAKKAAALFQQAADADPRNEEYFVRLAIANYWLGEIIPAEHKKERVEYYMKGEQAALKAMALNGQSVGGNFWAVVNNGRVTELKGILSGSFNFGRCLRCMTTVAAQEPDYYYGGVYRYWGQFIYEMPSMLRSLAQFTLEDSIYFARRSADMHPEFFLNKVYLAQSYLANKQREKARKELRDVINASPTVLSGEEPENRHYQRVAHELYEREFGKEK